MRPPVTLAYLAPEIPALSATFVYKEMLALEKLGYKIIPLSVHAPGNPAREENLDAMKSRAHYLYQKGRGALIGENLRWALSSPGRYFRVLAMALGDSLSMGFLNRVGLGLIYRFFVGAQVASILKREDCKHLHAHFAHVPADIAMYASALSGVPFSFTSHANDLFEHAWLLAKKCRRARKAVTISDFNRKFLIERDAPPEKVDVIHCGIDVESFGAKAEKPLSNPVRIGSLGRLVEKKGFDVLIRSCKILKDSDLAFQLEIAGNGPLDGELKALVRELGLENEICFIGPIAHDQVFDWLKNLDLFALAAKKDRNNDMDGIPVALMEAMQAGTPAISTRVSGIPELIENERTGLLVEPDQPGKFAEAVLKIVRDETVKSKIVQGGREKIRAEFNLQTNTNKLIESFFGGTS